MWWYHRSSSPSGMLPNVPVRLKYSIEAILVRDIYSREEEYSSEEGNIPVRNEVRNEEARRYEEVKLGRI